MANIQMTVCDCCGKPATKKRQIDVCDRHVDMELRIMAKRAPGSAFMTKKPVVILFPRTCPVCSKVVDSRGLKNHLRIHVDNTSLTDLLKEAEVLDAV